MTEDNKYSIDVTSVQSKAHLENRLVETSKIKVSKNVLANMNKMKNDERFLVDGK